MDETRWKKRFDNFERAYARFKEVFVDRDPEGLSEIEQTGGVQRFEFTFELAWKTLKDYLEYQGNALQDLNPRPVIKEAFATKILRDGKIWIAMLESRNRLSHTYNEMNFRREVQTIAQSYAPALEEFYQYFKARL